MEHSIDSSVYFMRSVAEITYRTVQSYSVPIDPDLISDITGSCRCDLSIDQSSPHTVPTNRTPSDPNAELEIMWAGSLPNGTDPGSTPETGQLTVSLNGHNRRRIDSWFPATDSAIACRSDRISMRYDPIHR
jgi:hypothetical protein